MAAVAAKPKAGPSRQAVAEQVNDDEMQQDEEFETSFTPIQKLEVVIRFCWIFDIWKITNNFLLQGCGISPQDIKRLQEGGFFTVEAVSYVPKKALEKVKGISDVKAEKIMASTFLITFSFVWY